MILKHLVCPAAIGLLISACGSDPPPPAGSYSAIADSLSHPTGKFESDNARAVADEFGKIRGLGAGGTRPQANGSSTSVSCGVDGTYSVNVDSASQSSAHMVLSYNNCCYIADCCMNGGGDWYYSTTSSSSFSYCGSYDLTYSCYGENASLAYSGCFDLSGTGTYVVTVASMTYAVSGTYSSGSGDLKVTAANGSWNCSFTATSGTCTGTSTFSI